jgi:hypothetical protein
MEFELATARQILERTPATLKSLLVGLSDDWLDATDGPDTWSPRQVVAHMLGGEREDWIPRLRLILGSGEPPPLPPFDRVAELEASGHRPIEELVAEFGECRRAGLRELSEIRLDDAALSRTGLHPEFGRVDVRQLLSTWAVHDLTHLMQIERTMAKQYAAAVGPWRDYLRILQ